MLKRAHRLLILSCSARKRPDPGYLPAIERYDGPAFRVLRRYLREGPGAEWLDIYVLSAFYGLIPGTYPIICYEQLMTVERAAELRKEVISTLRNLISIGYRNLCLMMSKVYISALGNWEVLIPQGMEVTVIHGTPGSKLTQLKQWLWEEAPDT